MFPSFDLFGKTIGTYWLFSMVGVFLAGMLACHAVKKHGQDDNNMIVFLLVSSVGVFLGSHLLYGITQYDFLLYLLTHLSDITSWKMLFNSIITIFGGSVFYGGLLGGIVAGIIYATKKRLDTRLYSDILAPAIPLIHAFGRIGCFMGGCCYGVKCSFGFVYTHSLVEAANHVRRFPIQLAESLFNFILFAVLAFLLRRNKLRGRLFALYILIYSFGRFILEFYRGDLIRGFIFGLSTSQFISILLFIPALLFILLFKQKHTTDLN